MVSIDIRNQYSSTVLVVPFSSDISDAANPSRVLMRKGEGGLNLDSVAMCDVMTNIEKRYLESLFKLGEIRNMNKTIELSSGKIIDLNRFVALLPDERTTNQEYHLILEGCDKAIALDATEAISVKEHLELKSNKNHNVVWDREEQLRKNQPVIELLKKRIARNQLMSEAESEQREEFLADFKKTVDKQNGSDV